MGLRLTRRDVLRWGLAGGAAALLPRRLLRQRALAATNSVSPSFFSAEEKRVLTAITGRIIPTDDKPGAIEVGAADYIDALFSFQPAGDANCDGALTAADLPAAILMTPAAPVCAQAGADIDGSGHVDAADAPAIASAIFEPAAQLQFANVFGGGPFSNRNPFPDPTTGTPSNRFPENDFVNFLPLTRLQLMSWRVQMFGSAAVPGADFNTAILGPVIGVRDQYRSGLADVEAKSQAMFSAGFADLTAAQQDQILALVDSSFLDLVTGHTLEGMFCAPEYGGNKDLIGWNLIGYDGDSQPLGYSIFNETTMSYTERADKPNSTANPDEDFSGVDATTQQFLKLLVRVVGGPHFP